MIEIHRMQIHFDDGQFQQQEARESAAQVARRIQRLDAGGPVSPLAEKIARAVETEIGRYLEGAK
jgi:hypothetical protein